MPNSILSEFLHAFFLSLQIIVEMVPTLEPKLGNCIYSLCHIWLVCFLFILKIPFHLIASSECWYSLDHFEIDALCLLEIFRIVVMKLVQAHECRLLIHSSSFNRLCAKPMVKYRDEYEDIFRFIPQTTRASMLCNVDSARQRILGWNDSLALKFIFFFLNYELSFPSLN